MLQQVGPPNLTSLPQQEATALASILPESSSTEQRLTAHPCCFNFQQSELLHGCRLAVTHPHLGVTTLGNPTGFPTFHTPRCPWLAELILTSMQRTEPQESLGVGNALPIDLFSASQARRLPAYPLTCSLWPCLHMPHIPQAPQSFSSLQ